MKKRGVKLPKKLQPNFIILHCIFLISLPDHNLPSSPQLIAKIPAIGLYALSYHLLVPRVTICFHIVQISINTHR